jgi:hypothetical protein
MKSFRNKSVDTHSFAMIPKADIPRSKFNAQKSHKTTFDAGYLVPIMVDEMLPGDSWNCSMTAFARLATPITPFMDNLTMDSFFFFVPNRLVWDHWEEFMGQQTNPGDSTSYIIPQMVSPVGGYAANSLQDYMGLPTAGSSFDSGSTISHSALWTRAYNLIYNEWFRDENLQNSVMVDTGDGPDLYTNYSLLRRGKRHDYFTSALPWPQKGPSVTLPLGGTAPVYGFGHVIGNGTPVYYGDYNNPSAQYAGVSSGPSGEWVGSVSGGQGWTLGDSAMYPQTIHTPGNYSDAGLLMNAGTAAAPNGSNLYTDLSTATAATVNQIRQSFQIQKLLERDARGGTRYTEILRAHFGVVSPDARLQRPEYIGGGSTLINVNPIAQTAGTGTTGTTTPQGNLAAIGTALAHKQGFTYSAVEHGLIIGLVEVRADLTYQQGLQRMWSRLTRYDFFFPVFSTLGEQTILNKEIYATGLTAQDNAVFGYQERWAEYRYKPSMITGLFRSTNPNSIDQWHLAQNFTSLPTLNTTFIQDTPPVDRVVAVGDSADGQQFLCDAFFNINMARPMPMYSVPGLIDHF